eukprot:Rhum_TRINITY_DN14930_c24_g1::Rhum_TRINITY_DN14930_c24_g1_i1::g.128983::m.128983
MRVNYEAQAAEWVASREKATSAGCVIYRGGLPAWLVRRYFRCSESPVLVLTKRPAQWERLFPRSGDNVVHPNLVFTVAEQLGATQRPELQAAGVLIVDVSVLSDPMRLHQIGLPYCDTAVTYPPAAPLRAAYAAYRRRRLPDVLAFDSRAYCAVVFDVSRPLTVRELCFMELFAAHAADGSGGDGGRGGVPQEDEVRRFVYCEDLPVRVLGLTAALVGCAIPPRAPHVEDALLDVQEADAVARANAFVREHVCVCEYGVRDDVRPPPTAAAPAEAEAEAVEPAEEDAVAVPASLASAAEEAEVAAGARATSSVAEEGGAVAVPQAADATAAAPKAAAARAQEEQEVPALPRPAVPQAAEEEKVGEAEADSEEVAAAVSRSPSVAASSTTNSSAPSPPMMPSQPPPQATHPLFLLAAQRREGGRGWAARASWEAGGRGGGGGG